MCLTCLLSSENCFFPLLPAIFFELPITRTLKVRVIGSRLYEENPGGGEGGLVIPPIFIRGGSAPRSSPIPFYIPSGADYAPVPFFTKKETPFAYLTNGTPFTFLG